MASKNFRVILNKILAEKNAFTNILDKIEKKTGCPKSYQAAGLGMMAAVIFLSVLIGYGVQHVCAFIGFTYPAYSSIKAIESKSANDQLRWLTYWVVFSLISSLSCIEIFFSWLPFYWLCKLILLLYIMAPTWNGSDVIYSHLICPVYKKYYNKIDMALNELNSLSGSIANNVTIGGKDAVSKMMKHQVDQTIAAEAKRIADNITKED